MTNHRNDLNKKMNPGETGNLGHTTSQYNPTEPLGLKRRHFMGTALALDAAALLAACGGGGGGGDAAGSGSVSSSGSTSSSASGSGSGSGSSSGSGSGSGSAAPTQWVVTTLAGTGAVYPITDGTGGTATFHSPCGVALDTSGHVYVADTTNNCIRKITPAGVTSTLAGTGLLGTANGIGSAAEFNFPAGIALDTNGNVYVAEVLNRLVRKISTANVVTTLAGLGPTDNGYVDGTGRTAKFHNPSGVALDTSGNVYVADSLNHRIRKIDPDGVVSTVAGTGNSGAVDGTGATAKFFHPYSVAVDKTNGNLYVSETDNHLIRKITPIYL